MMAGKRVFLGSVTLIGFVLLLNFFTSVSGQARGDEIIIEDDDSPSIGYVTHSVPASWEEAVRTCGRDRLTPQSPDEHMLLCFQSRDQITKLFAQKELQSLRIWLSSRNCNTMVTEKCLSLYIRKQGSELIWEFQNHCQLQLEFVCRKFTQKKSSLMEPARMTARVCPEAIRRNITWPATPTNTTVRMKCPNRMRGFAIWFCNGTTGDWGPGQPNLANCVSVALSDVLVAVENDLGSQQPSITNLQETASKLSRMVRELETGGDLTTTVQILDRVEDIFVSQAPAMSPAKRKETALDTTRHVINVCSQLLTKSEAWEDLDAADRYCTATTFLTTVDETGSIIASSIDKKEHKISTPNVVLAVAKPERTSTYKGYESFFGHGMNNMTLTTGPETAHIIFASYADLREILPLYQDAEGSNKKIVNSPVMSANTSGAQLLGKVQVRLMHFDSTHVNPTCVYWDVKRHLWSSDGCYVLETNNRFTVCECDHLTNFAILMDAHCATCELEGAAKVALATITVIGCSVSIFCLSVCIVIFTFFKSLWSMQVMIHRNLCICLLIAQGILLGGLDRTENKIVCACIAGLLHYFFLAAFFWMLLEAFHILWLLIKVFKPRQSHSVKYYLAGYGGPLLFLAANIGFKHKGYGTMHFCWLSSQDGTIFGFIAPVVVIILFNIVTLAYALFTTHHIVKNTERTQEEHLKLWIRGAAVLMPLLGTTWIVGFLYVEKNSIVFAYIFTALNSLQGFAIFLFHCLLNKKVKDVVWQTLRPSRVYRESRRSKVRTSNLPSSVSSPTRKRPASQFFFNQDHTETVNKDNSRPLNNDSASERSPNIEAKEEIPFLHSAREDRDRTNTIDLYPLDVERV